MSNFEHKSHVISHRLQQATAASVKMQSRP